MCACKTERTFKHSQQRLKQSRHANKCIKMVMRRKDNAKKLTKGRKKGGCRAGDNQNETVFASCLWLYCDITLGRKYSAYKAIITFAWDD